MRRATVDLLSKAVLTRYLVIEYPEDAELNELPWEEISNAADERGIQYQISEGPDYLYWGECSPPEDSEPTDVKIVKTPHRLRLVGSCGVEPTELRVADAGAST